MLAPLPVRLIESINKAKRVRSQLRKEFDRKPSPGEIVDELGEPLERVGVLLKLAETTAPEALRKAVSGLTPEERAWLD